MTTEKEAISSERGLLPLDAFCEYLEIKKTKASFSKKRVDWWKNH